MHPNTTHTLTQKLTIRGAKAPGSRDHGERGAAGQRADVLHVGVDVGVGRVEGRVGPHRRVPVGRDADEGDVGKRRAARQHRRPANGNKTKRRERQEEE